MTKERKLLWALLLVAFGVVFWYRVNVFSEPTPPAATTPTRLVFITGGTSPFWEATIQGAKDAAESMHAELQVEVPSKSESAAAQEELLDKLDLASIEGIAISPLDAAKQTADIDKLVEKVKVVTFDADAPDSKRHSHVGTSNFSAGRVCARLVGEAIPDGGKIAVFLANTTKENLIDRKGGFQEMIGRMADDNDDEGAQGAKYEVVEFFEDGGSADNCRQELRRLLGEEPDLKCLLALNSYQGAALVEELKELGKLDEIKIVSFDTNKEVLDAIEAGHIYATIAQDPYLFGHEAVMLLVSICQSEGVSVPIVGRGSNFLGVEPIRKDNLDEFRQRVKARESKVKKTLAKSAAQQSA